MNFLSHLFLSGDSEGIQLGNFIADSVKGIDYKNYSSEIQKGILLHRKIDTFTDQHPIVAQSKIRLHANYKKYAPVIVDIYYDHFLAIHWETYSNVSLQNYANTVYELVKSNHHLLPDKSALFSKYMIQYNILEAYANLEGIDRVLKGMANRAKFESNMEHAIQDLKEHYLLFQNEFFEFFPELQKFVNQELHFS